MNPMARWSKRLLIACLLAVFPLAPFRGQSSRDFSKDPFAQDLEEVGESAPTLSKQLLFRLVGEIALPGPLPGKGPRMAGDKVEIPVADGVAVMPVEPEAVAEIVAREPGPEFEIVPWTISPNGKRRFRTSEAGQILSEKRCKKCPSGWKKRWRHRLPGNDKAPPLLHEKRLFFAAMDNMIYCVKAGSGFQLWTSDVGGRTSRPLVVWTGGGIGWVSTSASPLTPTVIMVVPDSGSELLALSADTGQRVARIGLERGDGTLVGVPAMTPGGKVLVAHQKYDETEAALRIYELVVPGQSPPQFPSPFETPTQESEPRIED